MDPYGDALVVELYEGEANYVFITGFDNAGSNISASNADAIFVDGTYKSIRVNVKDTNENIKKVLSGNETGKDYFALWSTTAAGYPGIEFTKINRWFTYVEDENGVYTMNPATRMLTTAAHGQAAAKPSDIIKCNSVVLDSTDAAGEIANPATKKDTTGKHPTGQNVRVYGNGDSVFLLADLDFVDNSSSNSVITGVEAVCTSVQNVEINLKYRRANDSGTEYIVVNNGANPEEAACLYDNTYTVYDKNNYVIASVVIGETKVSSANYAFIRSAAKSEGKIGNKYYGTFDAVVDGMEKTLTVESKFASTINKLVPGDVMELRYTGDYVTEVRDIDANKIYSTYTTRIDTNTKKIYDVGHNNGNADVPVAPSSDLAGNKLSSCGHGDIAGSAIYAHDLHMVGRTLYLGAANGDVGLTFCLCSSSRPRMARLRPASLTPWRPLSAPYATLTRPPAASSSAAVSSPA